MTRTAIRARWIAACAVAAALGASMGYLGAAPGPPRLLADAILLGVLQALALGRAVNRLSWIGATVAAVGLGLVTGIVVVVGIGALLGPLVRKQRSGSLRHNPLRRRVCGGGCCLGRRSSASPARTPSHCVVARGQCFRSTVRIPRAGALLVHS